MACWRFWTITAIYSHDGRLRQRPFLKLNMFTPVSRHFAHVQMADLAEIRRFTMETAVSFSADPNAMEELILALNEAVTNIIVHGYEQKPGDIDITITRQGYQLIIYLRDNAPLFDPTSKPTPDITLPLAQRPFGGMGIHMMRAFTDKLRYQVTTNGQNELMLVKQCCHDEINHDYSQQHMPKG